jgi:four helix bundle protein
VPTIAQFEDVAAWRKGRELAKLVYQVTAQAPFARDFGLRDQMRRAAVSVLSNIAEGFERDGNKEFRQFLSLAKGSAGELRAQVYVALDVGLLDQHQFDQLCGLAIETSRLIAGFIQYLDASTYKGAKYK